MSFLVNLSFWLFLAQLGPAVLGFHVSCCDPWLWSHCKTVYTKCSICGGQKTTCRFLPLSCGSQDLARVLCLPKGENSKVHVVNIERPYSVGSDTLQEPKFTP